MQQYEINRLVKEAKQLRFDPYSLVMLRALAGISGKLDSAVLRQLIPASEPLSLDCHLPQLSQLKQTSLWLDGAIHALQPDLLAADLLHAALTQIAGDQAGMWQYCALEAASDKQEASSILGRLMHDTQWILKQQWPLQALIEWVIQDQERTTIVNDTLNRNHLECTLLPIALATDLRIVQTREQLARDNFAAYGPVLAASLNNLSNRLSDGATKD